MVIHKGYYLLILKQGKVVSYDGGHSSSKGVTKARDLIQMMNLSQEGSEYKMTRLKEDVSFEGKMADKFNELVELGQVKVENVKEQNVKINTKAALFMRDVVNQARKG